MKSTTNGFVVTAIGNKYETVFSRRTINVYVKKIKIKKKIDSKVC